MGWPRAIVVALAIDTGCGPSVARSEDGDDDNGECEAMLAELERVAEHEAAPLRDPIPGGTTSPIALTLGEAAIATLLLPQGIVEPPPIGGEATEGPTTWTFSEAGDRSIVLDEVGGCPHCVVLRANVGLVVFENGETSTAGNGSIGVAVPLVLRHVGDATQVVADFAQSTSADATCFLQGNDVCETPSEIRDAFVASASAQLIAQYEPVAILEVGTWRLGRGDITLRVDPPLVDPTRRKVVLGIQTNLPVSSTSTVDRDAQADDAAVVLSMHTDVLLAMSHRMLSDGEIPRRYDAFGDPDGHGPYAVSIDAITGDPSTAAALAASVRLWRIADEPCGWSQAAVPLHLLLAPASIHVMAGTTDGPSAGSEAQVIVDDADVFATFGATLAPLVAAMINLPLTHPSDGVVGLDLVDVTTAADAVALGLRVVADK